MPSSPTPSRARRATKPAWTARTADKHRLYQLSVQAPEREVAFLDRCFRKLRGRRPLRLREDFCGTAALCAAWVGSLPTRTATGVDIDPEVLAWGQDHNLAPLGASTAARVALLEQDVRAASPKKHELTVAFNYSYWVFRTRAELRRYFESVRAGLEPDGLFFLDCYGGTEAEDVLSERRKIKEGFTYVWQQAKFDPITYSVVNHIDFEFKDGSTLRRAFTYEWRFWTLPELQELLHEAGFRRVDVYWDRAKREDEERFLPTREAKNQPGWLAYLVAQR